MWYVTQRNIIWQEKGSKEPTQATVEMSLENNMINKASWASLVAQW